MSKFARIIELSKELEDAILEKDQKRSFQTYEELSPVFVETFDKDDFSFDCIKAYSISTIACLKYKVFNNMSHSALEEGEKTMQMLDYVDKLSDFGIEEKDILKKLHSDIEIILHSIKPSRNMYIRRYDTNCTLCRIRPANKTGSHMVPNFLAHPTFSWDGRGKRFHEALNHVFLNAPELNSTFYGCEVPEERFAKGQGKTEVTDEDIENNINRLEYDNEFCSICEKRFGVLESAYSQYYNGTQKTINPRVAYLFWLSVLWRMSMGSMCIFMDMNDELSLRRLLDEHILDTEKDIAKDTSDLGQWKYAIFRIEGMREGDKGILGHRKESAPYVVSYNDLVMVFYNSNPTYEELTIGPITVSRENINDWKGEEKSVIKDRRWFWDVRDWFVESSYEYYDPIREEVLREIREIERHEDRVIDEKIKLKEIDARRKVSGPPQIRMRLRKLERITGAFVRLQEAKENGEEYDPLKDEELFLTERDFEMYYKDLAALSKSGIEKPKNIANLPFYEEARKAIPEESEWNQFAYSKKIGRNDPCPCGSGLKYKKCCGKNT